MRYTKRKANPELDGDFGKAYPHLFVIEYHEGNSTAVVCGGMTASTADWMLGVLEGKPFKG